MIGDILSIENLTETTMPPFAATCPDGIGGAFHCKPDEHYQLHLFHDDGNSLLHIAGPLPGEGKSSAVSVCVPKDGVVAIYYTTRKHDALVTPDNPLYERRVWIDVFYARTITEQSVRDIGYLRLKDPMTGWYQNVQAIVVAELTKRGL